MFVKSQTDKAFNAINAHKCMLFIAHIILILLSLVAILIYVDVWPAYFMGAYHDIDNYVNIIFKCTFCLQSYTFGCFGCFGCMCQFNLPFFGNDSSILHITCSKFPLGILGKRIYAFKVKKFEDFFLISKQKVSRQKRNETYAQPVFSAIF